MTITPYQIALRYVGLREIAGAHDHPFIQWCFSLCTGFGYDTRDEVPWCSAFAQHPAWELHLPRSKSAAARSWLTTGIPIQIADARPGVDVAILKRGHGDQPGPEVLTAPGHVGYFAGWSAGQVLVLGGNQANGVSIAGFPIAQLLGLRRLQEIA